MGCDPLVLKCHDAEVMSTGGLINGDSRETKESLSSLKEPQRDDHEGRLAKGTQTYHLPRGTWLHEWRRSWCPPLSVEANNGLGVVRSEAGPQSNCCGQRDGESKCLPLELTQQLQETGGGGSPMVKREWPMKGPRGAGRPREEATGVGARAKDRWQVRRSLRPAGTIWNRLGRALVEKENGGWGLASILKPEGMVAGRKAAAKHPGSQENAGRGPRKEMRQ
ncbi:hypothetical protein NDU88_003033 [Pleurodeles waltl]|uniref:Uncharacterized protein n=1 Tax=Pleurodeles waltl TaxID=8319 RepID=A0AAV7NI80_PLEWA|nr:hypothetical protein NDU88_003033 [Pleurodeles waltl]